MAASHAVHMHASVVDACFRAWPNASSMQAVPSRRSATARICRLYANVAGLPPAGESGADAQSEAGGGSAAPATSAEMAALREEVQELKRLLLAALERLPSGSVGSSTGGGGAASPGGQGG